jgi:plasmid stabilization system protein ParE
VKLRISGRAKRELKRLDSWWRSNRDEHDLFLQEFGEVVELLLVHPRLGRLYPNATDEVLIRRTLMSTSKYHIYYAENGDELVVVSVWSAVRGRGPKL